MKYGFLISVIACLLWSHSGNAARVLYDFETLESVAGWQGMGERSDELPVDGEWGLLLTTPAWLPDEHGGQSTWPHCQTEQLPFFDWSKYDRIVFEFFNDSLADMMIGVFIADSTRKLQESTGGEYTIAPLSRFQCVLRFNRERIDLTDVRRLHFFTENPVSDFRMFVDSIRLLEPGEAVPEVSESYRNSCRERRDRQLTPERETRLATLATFDASLLPGELAKTWSAQRDAYIDFLLRDYSVDDGDSATDLLGRSTRFESLVSQYRIFAAAQRDDVIVGWASPMDKVLPLLPVFQPLPEQLVLSAARGEKESLQLLVQPQKNALSGVNVKVSMAPDSAATLPADSFSICPVGYVKTTQSPAYSCDYIGWWPDPLLPYLGAVSIEADTAQSFWLRLTVPEHQAPGVYAGTVIISSDGNILQQIPLRVQIYDFAVPKISPLNLAVTFSPEEWYSNWQEWHSYPDRPKEVWSKHRLRYTDMLADYYLGYDCLYVYGDWDFNMVAHLQKQGRFSRLNLGYFAPYEGDGANIRHVIETIRPRYEYAKKLGILVSCAISS